jgi:hypothetical protein
MKWVLIITCATGVRCGLADSFTKEFKDEWLCRESAKLGLALAGYDPAKFKWECLERK